MRSPHELASAESGPVASTAPKRERGFGKGRPAPPGPTAGITSRFFLVERGNFWRSVGVWDRDWVGEYAAPEGRDGNAALGRASIVSPGWSRWIASGRGGLRVGMVAA